MVVVTELVEFWVVPTVTAVPAVTVEPFVRSLVAAVVEVWVLVVASVVSDFLVTSLLCVWEETALLPVEEPVREFEVLPVESEFVVMEPSGFVTVPFVEEVLVWFRLLSSELFVALVCVALAV